MDYHCIYIVAADQLANILDDAAAHYVKTQVHPAGVAGWVVICKDASGIPGPWVAEPRAPRPILSATREGFPVEVAR